MGIAPGSQPEEEQYGNSPSVCFTWNILRSNGTTFKFGFGRLSNLRVVLRNPRLTILGLRNIA